MVMATVMLSSLRLLHYVQNSNDHVSLRIRPRAVWCQQTFSQRFRTLNHSQVCKLMAVSILSCPIWKSVVTQKAWFRTRVLSELQMPRLSGRV